MDETRRRFLKAAVTAAGAAATPVLPTPKVSGQDQPVTHQAVPSDLTLRVKSLESLLVEKGLVDRGRARRAGRYDGAQGGPAQRSAGGGARLGRSCLQEASAGERASRDRRVGLQQRAG